jgi:uroporphyrinogen-III decarboxylase
MYIQQEGGAVSIMVEESSSMYLSLDRFQRMKFRRMKILLKEIEEAGEIPVVKFLSYAANRWGIRRATSMEYLEDWCDGEYISIHNGIIKFEKKPEWWK